MPPRELMYLSSKRKLIEPQKKLITINGNESVFVPTGTSTNATAATSTPPPKATMPCVISFFNWPSGNVTTFADSPPKIIGTPDIYEYNIIL